MSQPIGIYIHVPFCAGKCPYCDFYSVHAEPSAMDSYTGAVLSAIGQSTHISGVGADTLYFGGGTPSLLGGERLLQIIDRLRPSLCPDAEITVECNPASDLEALLPQLACAGVNRVSLGMQSAVDSERKALGRRSGRARVQEAVALCRAAGITNISLDVMLGIPRMTMASLDETLDFVSQMAVPHISAYLLKIEAGTPFAGQPQLELPEEDLVCDQYLHTVRRLSEMGLAQYEVSNFSLPGYESRHNLKYWHCEPYLGIGPAAHSFIGGKRFYYPRDLTAFLEGTPAIPDGDGGNREEQLMLAFRLTEGVDPALLTSAAQAQAELLVRHGLLCRKGAKLSMTPAGFLLSNTILCDLIL